MRVLPGALKAIRKDWRDMTQKQLAKRAGCSLALVAMIETGDRQPSLETAEAIARVLEVPVASFCFLLAEDEGAAA